MAKEKKNTAEQADNKNIVGQYIVLGIVFVLIFGAGLFLGQKFFGDDDNEATAIESYFIDLDGNRHTQNRDWTVVAQEFNGVPMVLVPRGCFAMGNDAGSDDEKPVHQVCIDEPFWVDSFEVSNKQFAEFGGLSQEPSEYVAEDLPRNNLAWNEAYAYCQKRGGRLPSEAEWEYASRGVSGWLYPWGNEFDSTAATYFENGGNLIEAGGHPNGVSWVGAYDLSGNVWEWTVSELKDYPYKANDGREETSDFDNRRVLRGGSWEDSAQYMLATNRGSDYGDFRDIHYGVRCVRDFVESDLQ